MNLRALTISVLLVSLAVPTCADDDIWRPYVEVEGRTRNSTQIGHGNLFVPLWQDDSSLLFADLRGHWTDVHAAEGNWGLAYRRIVAGDWIVGLNGFHDMRHTRLGNNFQQTTLGAELLNVDWGFRVNGYVPQDRVRTTGTNVAVLQGGNIFVRRGEERAYHGVDFEAERLLWNVAPRCEDCTGGGSWVSRLNAQVWAAGGAFHFDNTAAGFEDITGPRARTELRLYDLPYLGHDSRVVLAAQYEHDHVRGSVTTGFLSVRIPFGHRARSRRLSRLQRRMVAPIVRDVDIITNAALGALETAKNARTGAEITGAVVIDANTPNPEAVVAGLGPNSVVIVDGSAGVILPANSIVMNDGQVLMGGGSTLDVIGCGTGTPVTFTGPGIRPTITQANNTVNTLVIANNVTVQAIDFTGGRNGLFSNGLDVSNVLIQDTSVTGAADDGYDFVGFTGLFTGNRAFNNGDDGFDFDGTINGTVSNNTATGNADHGFEFVDIGVAGVVVANLATGNGDAGTGTGNGFDFFDVFGVFANNTARDNPGNDGFNFLDVKPGGRVTGNIASNNRDDGFEFEDVESGGLMANNTATDNGDDGFEFFDVEAGGSMTNNTAGGNGDDGFVFEDVGGSFGGNVASGNGGNGFDFFDVESTGLAAGNNATGNGGDGFNFVNVDNGGQMINNLAAGNVDDGFVFDDVRGLFGGNVASVNGEDGFDFNDVSGVVSNNTASGNDQGFTFDDVESGGRFTGNVANSNQFGGILLSTVESGGLVANNTSNANGDRGFDFSDVSGTFSNNTAIGNVGDGFNLVDINAGGQFTGNVASGNTDEGFEFRDVAGLFQGNAATGNRNGYFFDNVVPGGSVLSNTATSNTVDGFNFLTNIAGGTFSDNTSNNNGDQGYDVLNPNAGTAVNNVGAGNTNGGNTFP